MAGARASISWCAWLPRGPARRAAGSATDQSEMCVDPRPESSCDRHYIVASCAAKMVLVLRVDGGGAGGEGCEDEGGSPAGQMDARLVALFPAAGQFGSPDGMVGRRRGGGGCDCWHMGVFVLVSGVMLCIPYTCTYACMHACMHACRYIHIHACIHACIHAHASIHANISTNIPHTILAQVSVVRGAWTGRIWQLAIGAVDSTA